MPRTSPTTPARTDLAATPLFPSLVRPALIAGLEREVVIPLVGLVLMLLFAFRPNFVTPTVALVVLALVFPALRRATKRDPQSFEVLKDHLRVAGYYSAAGSHESPRRLVPTLRRSR
jgi:type IV secretory pathway TrbD component